MRRRAWFIGCGGVGMVGLARIALQRHWEVGGSDLEESDNVRALRALGATVHIGHRTENLPDNATDMDVVYSSAIPADNPELVKARRLGAAIYRRGEYLALLASEYRRSVAVSGSHGKTTVTAMIARVLLENDLRPGFMIGGKPIGFDFPAEAGDGDIFVTEADESDLSLTYLKPTVALVTNVEDDHCWNVGGEEALYRGFARFAEQADTLIYGRSERADAVFASIANKVAVDVAVAAETFDDCSEWGPFQRQNAALATAAAVALGVPGQAAARAARTFQGVARRMRERYRDDRVVVMEDYAHHPTEVRAALTALLERFPGRRTRVVFQPHRYARLKRYFHDFVRELSVVDAIAVTPVFAAWTDRESVTSKDLAAAFGPKGLYLEGPWNEVAQQLADTVRGPELLAILGAGDIDALFPPLLEALTKARTK